MVSIHFSMLGVRAYERFTILSTILIFNWIQMFAAGGWPYKVFYIVPTDTLSITSL